MFRHVMSLLRSEVSGSSALWYVEDISRYHRIQASPGFREAAEYCRDQLASAGLFAEVHEYPADGQANYWGMRSFQEWACDSARLETASGPHEILADFRACPISLIQRSSGTSPDGVTAEVVEIPSPEDPGSYAGLDLAGKIVFARGPQDRIRQLAGAKGAVGLVTDNMNESFGIRLRVDIPDARQYTSFWRVPQDPPFFGFVLSPRQGDLLRKKLAEKSGPVLLKATVQASFYPGHYQVVDACIKGTTDEEVWGVAHLCHPKPSANDNASGSGAVIEAARALEALMASGKLPRPRRTIRFLLVPEMTGTYCYLSANEHIIPRVVAALNLDMVGENQDLCRGPLIVEKPPRAASSFAGELLAKMMEELGDDVKNLGGTSSYALFKHVVTPFSGGSDHYILSDPTVGIPCPMLIQWPDMFYHTSEDTIDKVDPAMLARVASLTATYLYFVACAGRAEALYIAGLLAGDFEKDASRLAEARLGEALRPQGRGQGAEAKGDGERCSPMGRLAREIAFRHERRIADFGSLARLVAPGEKGGFHEAIARLAGEMQAYTSTTLARAKSLFETASSGSAACAPASCDTPVPGDPGHTCGPAEWEDRARQTVPVRVFRGPVDLRGHLEGLPADRREHWESFMQKSPSARRLGTYLLYWADSKRNLLEIADMTELETGMRDVESMVRYHELLKECGMVH